MVLMLSNLSPPNAPNVQWMSRVISVSPLPCLSTPQCMPSRRLPYSLRRPVQAPGVPSRRPPKNLCLANHSWLATCTNKLQPRACTCELTARPIVHGIVHAFDISTARKGFSSSASEPSSAGGACGAVCETGAAALTSPPFRRCNSCVATRLTRTARPPTPYFQLTGFG